MKLRRFIDGYYFTFTFYISSVGILHRNVARSQLDIEEDDDESPSENLQSPNLFLFSQTERVDDKETQTKIKTGIFIL